MRTLPGNTRLQGPPTLQSNCFAVGQCGSTTSRQCLSLLSWRLSGRQCRRHTCGSRIAYTADRTAAGSVTWRCRQPIEGPRPRQKCSVLVGGTTILGHRGNTYLTSLLFVAMAYNSVKVEIKCESVTMGVWPGGREGGRREDWRRTEGEGRVGVVGWRKGMSAGKREAKYNSMSIAISSLSTFLNFVVSTITKNTNAPNGGGWGSLPYISYIGTFRQSGYHFQGPLS